MDGITDDRLREIGRCCILCGTVEVGQHEDVESLGVGSRTKRVQTLTYTGFANGLGLTP